MKLKALLLSLVIALGAGAPMEGKARHKAPKVHHKSSAGKNVKSPKVRRKPVKVKPIKYKKAKRTHSSKVPRQRKSRTPRAV
jgi:hypothetical protein